MARQRKGLPINGVLLLDKPIGITSNAAVQTVKRRFNAQKVGHTGALDPLATGMLPICLGEATKFSHYLLDADKTYQVTAQLGVRTNTSDADGEIIQTRPVEINETAIQGALTHFRGDILQVPTMFSALKHQGQPLYHYARQGITIEREARPITIYRNDFCHYDAERHQLSLEIHCSKGTYIRTIIDDLGERLGCGAHVIVLRRIAVANYAYDRMISFNDLEHLPVETLMSHLLPEDSPIQHYPRHELSETAANDLLLGRTICSETVCPQGPLRLYYHNQFLGLGLCENQTIHPKRLIKTES